MEKLKHCPIIKFFAKKVLVPMKIHNKTVSVLGNTTLSKTICKWIHEFKCGHTSIKDSPYSVRPKIATTPEIIKKNIFIAWKTGN